MRIVLKSLDSLKNLMKIVTSANRQALNEWFYNASDSELKQSIVFLNSKECLDIYPRHLLIKYIKFAQLLLSGELPEPPSDINPGTDTATNHFNFAKGCYILFSILKFLTTYKLQTTFKKIAIQSLTSPNINPAKLLKPLASVSRILMSRVYSSLNQAFNSILSLINPQKHKKFRTLIQNKKLLLKSIREIIKKGKVNLEQRAFWTWVVVLDEWKFGKVSGLKEDFSLLRSVGHSANLRYFHCLKESFDHWKLVTPMTIHSLLSTSPDVNYRPSSKSLIKRHFKKKLEKKFEVLVNFVYCRIENCFNCIQLFAEEQNELFQQQFRLAAIKPHIRNLAHIHRKLYRDALNIWKSQQYEYEYEETVITISNEKKNFSTFNKPITLLEFHEGSKQNKILIKNLNHIFLRKIRVCWETWNKVEKENLNLFGDDTLDLSIFKLNGIKYEKLNIIVSELLNLNEKRKNFPRVALNTWMQKANTNYLIIYRLKTIICKQSTNRISKKNALDKFQRNPVNRKEFNDIS